MDSRLRENDGISESQIVWITQIAQIFFEFFF